MKQVILAISVLASVVAGTYLGQTLKSGNEPGAAAGHSAGATGDESPASQTESSAHRDNGHPDANVGSEIFYFKFSREFVVPILRNGKVVSLVILNINIEADESLSQRLFSMEPKLRDNIMSTLVRLSNDSRTFENLTTVDSYETLRSSIQLNLENVVASGIKGILITDLARQDL